MRHPDLPSSNPTLRSCSSTNLSRRIKSSLNYYLASSSVRLASCWGNRGLTRGTFLRLNLWHDSTTCSGLPRGADSLGPARSTRKKAVPIYVRHKRKGGGGGEGGGAGGV